MSRYANVFALFNSAIANGLKYPKIRLQTGAGQPVVISRNGQMSRNPGHLSVTNGGRYGTRDNTYYGRITPSGEWFSNRYATDRTAGEVPTMLQELAADPIAVATRYGKLTGHCMFCEKQLTDPQSVALGYGPVCAKHYGLDHSRTEMRASNKPTPSVDLTQIMEQNGHLLDERPQTFGASIDTNPFGRVIDVQATVVEENDLEDVTVTAEEVAPKSLDEQREEAFEAAVQILKASEDWKLFGRRPMSIEEMRKALVQHMQAYKAR